MKRWMWLLLVTLPFFLAFQLQAQDPGKPTGFLNDYWGKIPSLDRQQFEAKLQKIASDSPYVQIAVVTWPDLGDRVLEDFSIELARKWGVGQKGFDNGVLVLIAWSSQENRVRYRIEVGDGMEGVLTDALCGRILDEYTVPLWEKGEFYNSLDQTVDKIASAAKGEFGKEAASKKTGKGVGFKAISTLIVLLLRVVLLHWLLAGIVFGLIGLIASIALHASPAVAFFVTVISALLGGALGYVVSGEDGYGGGSSGGGFGGGFSGGFGGFGGGGFSGGGASR